jgi:Recombination endonuclease VII
MPKPACLVCEDDSYCRGYCSRHYWRLRKYGDPLGEPESRRAVRFEETDDLENSKVCTICKKRLPFKAFHRSKKADGFQSRCRNCYRDWYNERYENNPEFREKRSRHFEKFYKEKYPAHRERRLNERLLSMYGITREEFDILSETQGNVCAICRRFPEGKTRLSVDHDHETGKIRGLLCGNCNSGLGHFKDNPELLAVAITYLDASASAQPTGP